jgi:hypothetical protein
VYGDRESRLAYRGGGPAGPSGSGFALVATLTPMTATTTTSTPVVPGRYYFVLRAFVGSWLSVASNEVTAFLI